MTLQGNFKNANKILQKLNALKSSTLRLLMLLDSLAYNPEYPNQCWYGATKLIKMLNTNKRTFFDDRFILEYAGFVAVLPLDKEFFSKNGKRLHRPKDQNLYIINRDYIYNTNADVLNKRIELAMEKRKMGKKQQQKEIENLDLFSKTYPQTY